MNYSQKTYLFNAAIMTHIYKYIKNGLEDVGDKSTVPDIVYRIKQQTYNFVVIHRFNSDDMKMLKNIETKEFVDKMSQEISFLMFSLHLMKLYTERTPTNVKTKLNISDKKLKLGTALWVVPMLKLRKEDAEVHKEYKKIIDKSKEVAEYFYNFMYENLLGEQNGTNMDECDSDSNRSDDNNRDDNYNNETDTVKEGNKKIQKTG